MRIAIRLEHLCNQGEVAKFEKDRAFMLDHLPDIDCDLCHGSGKRNDKVVQGNCNKCAGKGTVRPWACSYPFSEENVKEFAQFCRESGGFEIW
jgi:DnaJ-class molecular chaperone